MFKIKYLVCQYNLKKLDVLKINNVILEIAKRFNVQNYVHKVIIIDGESMDNNIVDEIKELDYDFYYSCAIGGECPNYERCFKSKDLKLMFKDEDYTTDYCIAKSKGYQYNEQVYNLGFEKHLFNDYQRGFYSSNTKEVVVNLEEIVNTYVDYISGYLKPVDTKEAFSKLDMFDNFNSAITGIMINNIGHELYHAYQDKHSKELCCIEATAKAYEIFVDNYLETIFYEDNEKQ